jgi:hypothetical protein
VFWIMFGFVVLIIACIIVTDKEDSLSVMIEV